jgi:flagellar assembly protein FliH
MAKLLKTITISDHHHPLHTPKAPSPSEDINKAHLENAFTQGFEQGLQKGNETAQQEWTTTLQSLHTLLQSIPGALETARLAMTEDIANIVLHIIERLFIHQQQDPNILTQQIQHILKQINQQQTIEIKLHPNDIANFNLNYSTLTPDPSLRLGGCIIKTEQGMFNACIERQIDQLKTVLLEIKQLTDSK